MKNSQKLVLSSVITVLSFLPAIPQAEAGNRPTFPPPFACGEGMPCHYMLRRVHYNRQINDPLGWCRDEFPQYSKDLYIHRVWGIAFCTLPYDPNSLS